MNDGTLFLEVNTIPNPTLLHVRAVWVPGGQPSWACLHWTVVPREHWPDGWLPPEDFRYQKPEYFPEATCPFAKKT